MSKFKKAKPKLKEVEELKPVELVDRIPSDNVDLDKLARFCRVQLEDIKADRAGWEARRQEYFQDIDNFTNYYTEKDLPFETAANLHIPVTLEKQRAVHARLYQALFGVKPPFYVEPQEAMDEKRLKGIYSLNRWALSRFVNYYKGINEEADGFLWNFASEGWGVMRLSWERKVRKALVVEPIMEKPKPVQVQPGVTPVQTPLRFKEVQKWIPVFEGPVIQNVQNEDFYMPGKGNIQNAPCIGFKTTYSAHQLRYAAAINYFDKVTTDKALDYPDHISNYTVASTAMEAQKGENQGYDLNADSNKQKDSNQQVSEYDCFELYVTYDVDEDGFDEELVVCFHPSSMQVLRWTYLDRITKTGRRPAYKADFIVRPGRNYALGLMELLHPLSMEVDAIHNQRVDFGTLSNMPFFFYKALSALPNQEITIAPGKGIPLDDPNSDVYFPQIKGGTQWGFQEENLLFQIINRVSAMGDLQSGQTPNNAEAVRSQGQMLAVLNEGNAQLDIPLRRVQAMFSEVYSDIHQMLVEKLPRNFQHVIMGEDDYPAMDPNTGQVMMNVIGDPRAEISGRVHFNIQTNSTAGSKALTRSNRIQLFQQLLNPINLQLGLVGPEEVYEMNNRLLDVSEEVNTKGLLKKPQNVPKPLSLVDELNMIRQGLMPEIPMNDDHANKSQALQAWVKAPSTTQGIMNGSINMNALSIAEGAIQTHEKYGQMIDQQRQMFQNSTGSQVPMAPGPIGGSQAVGTLGPAENAQAATPPGPQGFASQGQ